MDNRRLRRGHALTITSEVLGHLTPSGMPSMAWGMPFLGLDFGTTTTLAVLDDGKSVAPIKDSQNHEVIPSCAAALPNGDWEYGHAARRRYTMDPLNTIAAVKRIIGKSWHTFEVREYLRQTRLDLKKGPDGLPRFNTRAGALTAVDVATRILSYVREESILAGVSLESTTVTVPAAFNVEEREAIVAAVSAAGFDHVSTVEEPCAAARACDLPGDSNSITFVYDLGGGTFDAALIKGNAKAFEVLAVGGDAYLGGDDIDHRLALWVCAQVLENFAWDIADNPESFRRLLPLCEAAKIELSQVQRANMPLDEVDEVLRGRSIAVPRTKLQEVSLDLVRRTFLACDDVLRKTNLHVEDVDAVVLCGGGGYVPVVREGVSHYFGKEPISHSRPDQLVALGAAACARQRAGEAGA